MENKFDIGDFVPTLTEQSVLKNIIQNIKQRRKELKMTQKMLAQKSGVSYASIRRFETCGEISFSSLLKIANCLHSLDEFNMLFSREIVSNLKEY